MQYSQSESVQIPDDQRYEMRIDPTMTERKINRSVRNKFANRQLKNWGVEISFKHKIIDLLTCLLRVVDAKQSLEAAGYNFV
jgi:hypothetical protein